MLTEITGNTYPARTIIKSMGFQVEAQHMKFTRDNCGCCGDYIYQPANYIEGE